MPPPPAPSSIEKLPRLKLASERASRTSRPRRPPKCLWRPRHRSASPSGPSMTPPPRARRPTVLLAKGFSPQQRVAESPAVRRFWVYLDQFRSDATEMRVLHRLESAGIDDAEAMPADAGGRRVSLGLFTDSQGGRAPRQGRAVDGVQARDGPADAAGHRVLARSHAPECVDARAAQGRLGPGAGRRQLGDQRATLWLNPTAESAVDRDAIIASSAVAQLAKVPRAAASSPSTLPRCKPGGGGPVPCVVVKAAPQASVL